MKSTSKFFLGLTCGLLISFFIFNSNAILNANTSTAASEPQAERGDITISGSSCTSASMQDKINSYRNEILPKLPSGASTGGFIKRSVLNNLTGMGDGAYLKYQFYHEGNGKIGIFFQKKNNQEYGIRTGSAAFCPMMCDYPE